MYIVSAICWVDEFVNVIYCLVSYLWNWKTYYGIRIRNISAVMVPVVFCIVYTVHCDTL